MTDTSIRSVLSSPVSLASATPSIPILISFARRDVIRANEAS